MWRLFSKRMSLAAAVASTAALAASADAAVAAPFHLDFPAGMACRSGWRWTASAATSESTAHSKARRETGTDPFGGRGFQLTFTNLSSNSTFALPANGAVMKTVINADGSETVTTTGHNVLILFPSDLPAGPSTTLYVGRVVYTVDTNGVFTLVKTSGTNTDICAALS